MTLTTIFKMNNKLTILNFIIFFLLTQFSLFFEKIFLIKMFQSEKNCKIKHNLQQNNTKLNILNGLINYCSGHENSNKSVSRKCINL